MKSVRFLQLGSLALVAACVPQPSNTPQPQPQQPQRPVTPQVRPPAPAPDWSLLPLSPGRWYYRNEAASSQALFGPPNGEASFIVRCDKASRQVTLSREGITTGNTMTVRTSFGARNFPLSVQTEPLPYVFSAVSARDSFLDSIVFSRGRFTVQVPGTPLLVIPSWPEPARVVEDCRG